jgi:citrate lyase subunit gamma (acyl carrier protein)
LSYKWVFKQVLRVYYFLGGRDLKILRTSTAGTLESSDILISLSPAERLSIEIESPAGSIFGDAIRDCINAKLAEMGVTGAKIFARDRGALDCVISARVEAAVLRAAREET